MKKLIALLIAICMMASLAACGGSQAAPQGQSEDSDAAAVTNASGDTLVVAIWDNNQLAGLQKIADEWSAKSGIKVQINVISWVEYWTLLEAGEADGVYGTAMNTNDGQDGWYNLIYGFGGKEFHPSQQFSGNIPVYLRRNT